MDAKTIKEINQRKGAHKFFASISTLINTMAALSLIVGTCAFFLQLYHKPLPQFASAYNVGLLSAFCAAQILILNQAYDRYYDCYTRASFTTSLGDSIDVAVKLVLLAATVVLAVEPLLLIPAVVLAYWLDRLRLWDLQRSLEPTNPLSEYLATVAIPNNNRHNFRLLLVLFLYVGTITKVILRAGTYLIPAGGQLSEPDFREASRILTGVLTALFCIIWSTLVLHKRIYSRNPMLTAEGLSEMDKRLADYYRGDNQDGDAQ